MNDTDTVPTNALGDQTPGGTDGVAHDRSLRARWHQWRWLLPWALVVLAVAVALASTWQWQQLAAEERERDTVAQHAGTFMLALTNWDAIEGMAPVREELRTYGTERFAGEVDELFGTTEDLRGLEDLGARSKGEVRRLFVQEIGDERAMALAVLVQRLTTDVSEGEEISVRYAEVELLRAPDEAGALRRLGERLSILRHSGSWLVDGVELLVDVGQQEAQPVAPGADDPQEAP